MFPRNYAELRHPLVLWFPHSFLGLVKYRQRRKVTVANCARSAYNSYVKVWRKPLLSKVTQSRHSVKLNNFRQWIWTIFWKLGSDQVCLRFYLKDGWRLSQPLRVADHVLTAPHPRELVSAMDQPVPPPSAVRRTVNELDCPYCPHCPHCPARPSYGLALVSQGNRLASGPEITNRCETVSQFTGGKSRWRIDKVSARIEILTGDDGIL